MPEFTIIKLTNMTPLHMGTGRETYDFSESQVHSDTLSAALASVRASIGRDGDIKDFLASFRLSSAFPYSNDKCFLPLPSGKLNIVVTDMDEYPSRKKLKKLKYAEAGLWQKLMSGQQLIVKKNQLQKEFLISESFQDFTQPTKSVVQERVSVPYDSESDAEPFFFNWTYFRPNCGLYCIIDASETVVNEVFDLFQMLGDFGIGTDRNIGGGHFVAEKSNISIPSIENSDSTMLLSLYIPSKEDINILDLKNDHYCLIRRNGFISGCSEVGLRHIRKKTVLMFTEGSVFKTTHDLQGDIVDVRPEWNDERIHSVFRSGVPFAIKFKGI